MIHRRGLIKGLISFVAAPAIVRIDNIMPVKKIILPWNPLADEIYWRAIDDGYAIQWRVLGPELYQDLLKDVLEQAVQPLPIPYHRIVWTAP